ncbi:tRNA pseudouridine(13) synthase TruD, partial [Candidatus Bathyarchaeota archaeon]
IEKIYAELCEKGIPNYFGLQRFGFRLITHEVGKLILQRKYSDAFWTYVAKPSNNEDEKVKAIRKEVWDSRDAKVGLKEFPKHLRYERFLLQKIREGTSEIKALLLLPKNLKMLFIHAYQSYIFNKLLSLRIKEFKSLKIVEKDDFVDFVELKKHPSIAENPVKISNLNKKRVNFLVKQRIAYLALPLPGYEIKGCGWSLEKSKEILENDGLSYSDFKHEFDEFSSKGSYRLADMPVWNFKYKFLNNSVIFDFFIPKGCYATVLLREFTKKDFF